MISEPGLDPALRNKEIIGMTDKIKIGTKLKYCVSATFPEFDHYTTVCKRIPLFLRDRGRNV